MLAGPARTGGPEDYVRVRCTARPGCKGVRGPKLPSGPVRSGPGSRGPVLMLKRPPGWMAVGRAERRGRDQVVKLSRNPGRDPSLGAGERLEAAGCRVEGPVTPPEWAWAEPGREVAFAGQGKMCRDIVRKGGGGTRMRRTPVRKENGVCLVDAAPTHLGWVKWCLPTGENPEAGEQNYAGEAVAAWQCEDVSRFCWYFARGELKGFTVGDSCVTFINGCEKGE